MPPYASHKNGHTPSRASKTSACSVQRVACSSGTDYRKIRGYANRKQTSPTSPRSSSLSMHPSPDTPAASRSRLCLACSEPAAPFPLCKLTSPSVVFVTRTTPRPRPIAETFEKPASEHDHREWSWSHVNERAFLAPLETLAANPNTKVTVNLPKLLVSIAPDFPILYQHGVLFTIKS